MKNNIFLTSVAKYVMQDIAREIGSVDGKRLLFINTASEVGEGEKLWLDEDKQSLVDAGFDVVDYTIASKSAEDIEKVLKGVDVLYISGGNVFYLLQEIQKSGFAKIVRSFVDGGGVYIATSAGSVVAGPDIYPAYNLDEPEVATEIDGYKALGLVDFVVLPHWGSEKFRELFLNQRLDVAYTEENKIILLTDNQYVRVQEDGMYKIEDVQKK